MSGRKDFVHICDFSTGMYFVQSRSGGTGVTFEDSEQFGPSKVNARTGDLSPISDRLAWFWDWYTIWRAAGRPTNGLHTSTPCGDIMKAKGPGDVS